MTIDLAQHSVPGTQDFVIGNLGGGHTIANSAKKSAVHSLKSAEITALALAVLANLAIFANSFAIKKRTTKVRRPDFIL